MSQAPFVQPKARGQAQLSEGLQHVDLYDCIYRIISSGIKNTEEYINKPLMILILRVMTVQMNIMETMDETNRLETEKCGSTSVQLVQLPTHSNIPDVSIVRNTGTVEQTIETEQCGSTSVQLVQLPTHSNIPGVSMVRNTGTVEQTIETEQCGSTSLQLVQLPTHSNNPGISMVRNTRDSEDRWYYRADNRIRAI